MAPSAGLVLEKGHQSFWPSAWLTKADSLWCDGARSNARGFVLRRSVAMRHWCERRGLSSASSHCSTAAGQLRCVLKPQPRANWISIWWENPEKVWLLSWMCSSKSKCQEPHLWCPLNERHSASAAFQRWKLLCGAAEHGNSWKFTDSETRPVKFGCAKKIVNPKHSHRWSEFLKEQNPYIWGSRILRRTYICARHFTWLVRLVASHRNSFQASRGAKWSFKSCKKTESVQTSTLFGLGSQISQAPVELQEPIVPLLSRYPLVI
jgi:hypothetical protein